jgi:hypothetical protein
MALSQKILVDLPNSILSATRKRKRQIGRPGLHILPHGMRHQTTRVAARFQRLRTRLDRVNPLGMRTLDALASLGNLQINQK